MENASMRLTEGMQIRTNYIDDWLGIQKKEEKKCVRASVNAILRNVIDQYAAADWKIDGFRKFHDWIIAFGGNICGFCHRSYRLCQQNWVEEWFVNGKH